MRARVARSLLLAVRRCSARGAPGRPRRRGERAPLVVSRLHARRGRARPRGRAARRRAAPRRPTPAPTAPSGSTSTSRASGSGTATTRASRSATACCRACGIGQNTRSGDPRGGRPRALRATPPGDALASGPAGDRRLRAAHGEPRRARAGRAAAACAPRLPAGAARDRRRWCSTRATAAAIPARSASAACARRT